MSPSRACPGQHRVSVGNVTITEDRCGFRGTLCGWPAGCCSVVQEVNPVSRQDSQWSAGSRTQSLLWLLSRLTVVSAVGGKGHT